MSAHEDDRDKPIREILALLGRLSEKLEPENLDTKRWMAARSTNPLTAEILLDSPMLTLRVLDAIGRSGPVNAITVSNRFGIPRGSVSKATRRLLAGQLVVKEPKPNNRKEVFYHLTDLGRDIFLVHRAFDQTMERGFVAFLKQYSGRHLSFVAELLRGAVEANFLELGAESHIGENRPSENRMR